MHVMDGAHGVPARIADRLHHRALDDDRLGLVLAAQARETRPATALREDEAAQKARKQGAGGAPGDGKRVATRDSIG